MSVMLHSESEMIFDQFPHNTIILYIVYTHTYICDITSYYIYICTSI